MKKKYKKIMKDMIEHRKNYFPLLKFFLEVYNGKKEKKVEIKDFDLVMVTMELLDNGYLNSDNFQVNNVNGNLNSVTFNSLYPLTGKGEELVDTMEKNLFQSKLKKFLLVGIVGIAVLIVIILKI